MPPTQWSYDDTIKDAPYNIEKAKELLKEAGIKEGTEITLWAMPVQRPYNPNAKLMAEMLQSDWSKIGIKAKIMTYEWGEYIKRSKGGENGAMLIGWSGDNGDPDNWLGTLFGCDAVEGNNFSKWCNPEFDKLVKEAKATTDIAERTKLYKQAQQLLKSQVPMTPIANSTVYQPMRKNVENYKISPFGLNSFYGVGISK
jgi:ABC-type dipeptide transport system, periplasmic component